MISSNSALERFPPAIVLSPRLQTGTSSRAPTRAKRYTAPHSSATGKLRASAHTPASVVVHRSQLGENGCREPDYPRCSENSRNPVPVPGIMRRATSIQPSPSLTPAGMLAAWGRVLSGRDPVLSIEITRECSLSMRPLQEITACPSPMRRARSGGYSRRVTPSAIQNLPGSKPARKAKSWARS